MVEVNSLDDFIKEINKFESKEYFYRGENRLFECRSPSIYQQPKLLNNASTYYNRLLAELPNSYDKTPFETLSRLQHYGALTRMLDITSNPLVALFFASKEDNEAGYIYVYKSDNLKFETGHTAIMKAAINFIPNDIIKKFLENETNEADEEFISKLNEVTAISGKIYSNPQNIRDDLKKAHVIIAKKQTSRISRQSGNFILPAFELSDGLVNDSIKQLSAPDSNNPIVFKVPKKSKNKILSDLAILGIHEGSVYPDVENQTKYLIRFFGDFPVKIDDSSDNKLKREIIEQYQSNQVMFKGIDLYDAESNLKAKDLEFLKGFHTVDSAMITENDNYFAGIRADHFVVEIGYSESPFGQDDIDQKYAIITANHKGDRVVTCVKLKGSM